MNNEAMNVGPIGSNPWRGPLVLLTLAHVMGTVGYVSVMAMAPVIREDLMLNATQVGSFMSAFYFALALSALPSGTVVDRTGVGWALVISMVLLALGAAGFAMADSYIAGVASTFVMGLGYGLVNPATAKGVLDWFKPEHRATAMGVKQTGVPIGGLLASASAAVVVVAPWRGVLWAFAAATLLLGLVWWRHAENPRGRRPGGLPAMLMDIRTVAVNRGVAAMNGAGLCFNGAQQSMTTYLTLFLRDVAGSSQPFAGFCLGVAQVTGAAGRILWSIASDRVTRGRRKGVMVMMMSGGVVTCTLAAMVGEAWPAVVLVALAAGAGATILAYAPLLHTVCAEAVKPELAGAAIGSNLLATSVGGTVGPLVFGAIVDATGGYTAAWIVAGAVIGIGVLITAFGLREPAS
ncbi:MAG: MFS transporter [Rhodospirillaceae bacterium]|nr:MFS transporter [Rhodospirillaceae bacterium]